MIRIICGLQPPRFFVKDERIWYDDRGAVSLYMNFVLELLYNVEPPVATELSVVIGSSYCARVTKLSLNLMIE